MESTTLEINFTMIDYEFWGEYESDPMDKEIQIFYLISYCLVFILGTIGNGLVIFITGFRMKKTVHTIWILNLAVADFTLSGWMIFFIVPVSLDYHWPFGEVMCQFSHFMVFFNLFASIYLLVVISVDRCVAVWCPVWAQNHRTPRLASFVVLGVWILALVLSSPKFYFMKSYYKDWEFVSVCIRHSDLEFSEGIATFHALFSVRLIFGFLFPFGVIVFCYGAIVVRLRRDQMAKSSKPFKVITAVIVAFFVCWFPFHVCCFFYGKAVSKFGLAGEPLSVELANIFTTSLAFANSCLNPILYFCMGHNFKERLRCSLLSAFESAFAEDSNHRSAKTKATPSMELDPEACKAL